MAPADAPAVPSSIDIPPPPELDPPQEPTNTLALLLPHQALFAPPVLQLLRDHYSSYGEIAHWAPVRAFGRAIVVFVREDDAERAKKEGDWLKLDLGPVPGGERKGGIDPVNGSNEREEGRDAADGEASAADKEYFDRGKSHRRRKSFASRPSELILRLHYLPHTPLNVDQASLHLAPPALPHNFLISPPGSPPEGWEPVQEDAPNTAILAEDLQRALEALQLNSGGGQRGGKEVILEEGGVRVEVEDTDKTSEEDTQDGWGHDVEEHISGSSGVWASPSQAHGTGFDRGAGAGVGGPLAGLGGLSGSGTPMGKVKIVPTAMPPR
ncbi:hypothetical protein IAU60_005537 [Kwoniella sp. DSM 27419]